MRFHIARYLCALKPCLKHSSLYSVLNRGEKRRNIINIMGLGLFMLLI